MNIEALGDKDTVLLLKPKALTGAAMEYSFTEGGLVITSLLQIDSGKRKIEVPWNMLGRFISELQEVEKIIHR